uniref:U2266c n=1 Tax=Mycobacterium leprae TaxID=1769 RepID=Q50021_MYCLR|nr:u2266c [Mycobacterium leprae]
MNSQRSAALAGMPNIMAVGDDVVDARVGIVTPFQLQSILAPVTSTAIFLGVTIDISGEATVHDTLSERSGLICVIASRSYQPLITGDSESVLTPGIDCLAALGPQNCIHSSRTGQTTAHLLSEHTETCCLTFVPIRWTYVWSWPAT